MRSMTAALRTLASLRTGIALALVLITCACASTQPKTLRLLSIDAVVSGGQIDLHLKFSRSAPRPSVAAVDNPARLAIDLPGTTSSLAQPNRRIDKGPIQSIATTAAHGHTRVVVKLSRMEPYSVQRRGDELIVHFDHEAPARSVRAAHVAAHSRTEPTPSNARSAPAAAPRTSAAGNERPNSITRIDFRRVDHDAGRVNITLNTTDFHFHTSREDGRVIIKLSGIHLSKGLARRYDVNDFATPVKTIDALSQGKNTRITVTPSQGARFKQQVYQADNHLYVEFRPQTKKSGKKSAEARREYTGKSISLSLQNANINSVLQNIAAVAGVNLVVSDQVSGNITLKLEDIPWDQALDVILDAKHLGMTRQDNVIMVAPLKELSDLSEAKARARRASRELAPLHSEVIQINYARAADIAQILHAEQAGRKGRAVAGNVTVSRENGETETVSSEPSLLSERGHVTVDDRTNSLLVTDTSKKLEQIHALVDKLDVPVRQVLIQTRIVVANREFSRNLGISQRGVGKHGDLENPIDYYNNGYSISLPAAESTATISSSIITDTFSLNLQLSAMESENEGEIISSPRVITADGQEANIEQGREIPYQEGSRNSTAGTSVTFKKAVLSLNVTPHITPNQQVIMGLKVTQDTVGDFVPTAEGGRVPSINTRSLDTRVLVGDGDTVVLGGIFERTKRNRTDGVPFLSKIPLFGALFQGTQRENNKRELLIFVTPRIMNNNMNPGERSAIAIQN